MLKALGVTFLISWLWVGIYALSGGSVTSYAFLAYAGVLMWIPGLCGLYFSHQEGFKIPVFKKPGRYDLYACLSALAIAGAAIAVSVPFDGPVSDALPNAWTWLAILVGVIAGGVTVNMLFAVGEELFWRGYLFAKLQHLGIFRASLLTGIIWGLWHAPVIALGYNYPGHPWQGVLMMILLTTSMSPLMFFFRQAGRAVMTPAIFHGSFNASAGLVYLVFEEPDRFLIGATGLAGLVVMSAASVLLLACQPAVDECDQQSGGSAHKRTP